MKKRTFLSASLAAFFLASQVFADNGGIGIVNFTSCITDSKSGKKEQENMENIRKQMTTLIEETEKEIKELSAKFEDTEFLDSLSPKAEEEMKMKYQTLQEDLGRYQNQFYQVLQHAQYQLIQKMNGNITKASEAIAKEKNLDYVINKEACFYIRPDFDVTGDVINEMDKLFELESNKAKKLSDNSEEAGENNAVQEIPAEKAS